MDETEITNSEYRQFVNWVRDSIVRQELAEAAYFKIGDDINEDDPLWEFMPVYNRFDDDDEKSAYQVYLEENGRGFLDIENKSTFRLNWDIDIEFDRSDYLDANYAAVLEGGIGPDLIEDYEGFFIPADSTPNGLRAFKTKVSSTLLENLILKKINGPNMNPLKFILTQLFGIRILNIVIMNQCITTISGMMLMLIIL